MYPNKCKVYCNLKAQKLIQLHCMCKHTMQFLKLGSYVLGTRFLIKASKVKYRILKLQNLIFSIWDLNQKSDRFKV